MGQPIGGRPVPLSYQYVNKKMLSVRAATENDDGYSAEKNAQVEP
jgi:hypothetical protein